jgi:hypothetical protein
VPVKLTKQKKSGRLVCERCGIVSKSYKVNSPAAPDLSICEAGEKDNWSYDIGFWSMLLGHHPYCPDCAKVLKLKIGGHSG